MSLILEVREEVENAAQNTQSLFIVVICYLYNTISTCVTFQYILESFLVLKQYLVSNLQQQSLTLSLILQHSLMGTKGGLFIYSHNLALVMFVHASAVHACTT